MNYPNLTADFLEIWIIQIHINVVFVAFLIDINIGQLSVTAILHLTFETST